MKRIAVIGAGISGLSSAMRLLEAGWRVDIFSRDEAARTTSMAAGAFWWPHKAYPAERVSNWARASLDEYKKLLKISGAGISLHQHYRFCEVPDDASYAAQLLDDWEELDVSKIEISCRSANRLCVPLIEVPIFMPWLEQRVREKGGRFHIRELGSPGELFSEYDLVVNCSGVWARYLVGDKTVYPIRGQAVLVDRPAGISESRRIVHAGEILTLVLPRSTDCVLGGTSEKDNWSLDADPGTSREIIERCTRLQPLIKGADVLGSTVGLRPGRDEIRLEREEITPGRPLIHNYGHGGGGFTVCWGCADEVAGLVRGYFAQYRS